MARITIEDCLRKVESRFELVHLAAQRVRQIREGSEYLVSSPKNEDIVVALREIAAGKVTQESIDTAGDLFVNDAEAVFSPEAVDLDADAADPAGDQKSSTFHDDEEEEEEEPGAGFDAFDNDDMKDSSKADENDIDEDLS